MKKDKMYDLLIRSMDSELKESDRAKLEEALSASESLREEREKLLLLRRLVSFQELQFRTGFAERVMNRLKGKKNGKLIEFNFAKDMNRIFMRVAITGVAAILLLLLSIYMTAGSISLDTLSGTDSYSEDNVISYLLFDE